MNCPICDRQVDVLQDGLCHQCWAPDPTRSRDTILLEQIAKELKGIRDDLRALLGTDEGQS